MSGRIRASDVDGQFDQLVRAASRAGADTDDWILVPGEDIPRTEWSIATGGRPLRLGYTRREVFAALAAMNAILSAVEG